MAFRLAPRLILVLTAATLCTAQHSASWPVELITFQCLLVAMLVAVDPRKNFGVCLNVYAAYDDDDDASQMGTLVNKDVTLKRTKDSSLPMVTSLIVLASTFSHPLKYHFTTQAGSYLL